MTEETESQKFERLSIEKMRKHRVMVDSHTDNMTKAATARIALQGTKGKEVLKEVATAAGICESTIDYFGDEDPIPWSVLEGIKRTQRSIVNATSAVVMMMALGLDLGN